MWVVSRGGLSLACVVIVLAIVTVSRGPTVTALLTRRKIKDQNQVDADVVSAIDMQALYHQAREDVLQILNDGDGGCENSRKNPDQRCTDAADCGKGWLFRRKQLLLAITGLPAGGGGLEWHAGDVQTVTVVGLRDGGDGKEADCDARDLSMLLRLQGEEALAEAAVPVEGRCAWTVEFRTMMEGTYTFDATLINWKGRLEQDYEKCNEVVGAYGEGAVKMAAVPSTGGPFFGTFDGCCSLCTRTEGCVAWSATNRPDLALVQGDRCVMYSSVVGDPEDNEGPTQSIRSGTSRKEEAMTFLGPAMAMGRSWCSERNGQLMGSGVRVVVETPKRSEANNAAVAHGAPTSGTVKKDALPLCRSNLLHDGRWVSLDHEQVHCEEDGGNYSPDGWPEYDKNRFGTTLPEACFLKPKEKAALTAEESHLAPERGYVWKPYECRYDLMDTDSRRTCLKDMNVTRFLDFGDSLVSTSRMPRTALWLPNVPKLWSTGTGKPQAAQGRAAAGCGGGGTTYYGEDHQPDLTTRYCGASSYWQVPAGQLRVLVGQFLPDVVLINWAMVHRLWHHSEEKFKEFLLDLGKQLDAMTDADQHRPRYMFWLPAPFLVGEREPHCVLERAIRFNALLRELLEPRGWIEVDWVSLTKKWSLDITDGMHHGPPPTRMLAYMMLHQVCHGSAPP